MKLFIAVLALIFSFQSWTKADDIGDLQIEGMSMGESLLDYFSKSEIENSNMNYYKKKKFITIGFNNSSFLKTYDWLQLSYEREDKNYKIANLDGVLSFKNNYDGCLIKKKEITKDIQNSLNKKPDNYGGKHNADKSGKSLFESSEWNIDGGTIIVQCINWSKKMEKQFFDHLKVWIGSNEFMNWVKSDPY